MANYEKNNGSFQKYKTYTRAASALKNHPKRVKSGEEAKKLDGIGAKIAKKIDEILSTGKLCKLEKYLADPKVQAINRVAMITGVGSESAKKIVNEWGGERTHF